VFSELLIQIKKGKPHRALKSILNKLCPKLTDNLAFYKRYHRFIDYKKPKLLDEKLLRLKCIEYANNQFIADCADKIKVRDCVASKGFLDTLVPLLGTWDKVSDINWNELPQSFAIKCNHGCGMNIIVPNKNKLDVSEAKRKLQKWMDIDYGFLAAEPHYSLIKPKILCEEYIGELGTLPIDYKFHCSRGNVFACQVILERQTDIKYLFVNKKYEELAGFENEFHRYKNPNYKETKPSLWEQMIKIAEALSYEFPYVRVDLYYVKEKVVFGELTFTPRGGILKSMPINVQQCFGGEIKI
jgi:hypothetical protein